MKIHGSRMVCMELHQNEHYHVHGNKGFCSHADTSCHCQTHDGLPVFFSSCLYFCCVRVCVCQSLLWVVCHAFRYVPHLLNGFKCMCMGLCVYTVFLHCDYKLHMCGISVPRCFYICDLCNFGFKDKYIGMCACTLYVSLCANI